MSTKTRPGQLVRFERPKAGFQLDQDRVQDLLVLHRTYTVSRIEVGRSSTQVWLCEVPDVAFNSVHFVNTDEWEATQYDNTADIREKIGDQATRDMADQCSGPCRASAPWEQDGAGNQYIPGKKEIRMNANQRLNHISLLARLLKRGSYEQNVYDAAELIDADTVEISREIQYTDEAAGVMSSIIGNLRDELDCAISERNTATDARNAAEAREESLQRKLDDLKQEWAKTDSNRLRARGALEDVESTMRQTQLSLPAQIVEITHHVRLGLKFSKE
jgi:hypothetical protein